MALIKNRFYKYLITSEDDQKWGVFLKGAGFVKVEKNSEYPSSDHPSHHYFQWERGRRLTEYQILYITGGTGVFESEVTGRQKISQGDVIFLFPGIWHRYKPDKSTGWTEYWVEFNGDLISHFRKNGFLVPSSPVHSIGLNEEIVEDFLKINRLVENERPGFQYIASGILMQTLGKICAIRKNILLGSTSNEKKIREAKLIILENLALKLSQEDVAQNLGMSYSLYRKKFREYTGISPASYQMQMRINIAKHLLTSSVKNLKDISHELGFESPDYFYRFFKQKTGFTPSEFRDKDKR
jgi:AraC-like DNA-binding protein